MYRCKAKISAAECAPQRTEGHRKWSLWGSVGKQVKMMLDEKFGANSFCAGLDPTLGNAQREGDAARCIMECWPSKYACQLHSMGLKPHLKSPHRGQTTTWGPSIVTLAITAPSSTFLCYLLVVNRGFPLPDCPVRFSLQTYWHFAWGAGEGGRIELQELSLSGHPSNNFYHVVVAKQQQIRERFFCTQKTERVALVSFSPFFRSKKKWREIERSSCRLCRNHSG